MNTRAIQVLLVLSSLVALGVGAALLLTPVAFEASAGISLGLDPSTLSETRAPGGALVAIGALIGAGAFVPALRHSAISISAAVYLGYGLSRVLSIALDGVPAPSLLAAMALELVLGLACVGALWKRESNPQLAEAPVRG